MSLVVVYMYRLQIMQKIVNGEWFLSGVRKGKVNSGQKLNTHVGLVLQQYGRRTTTRNIEKHISPYKFAETLLKLWFLL